MTSPTAAAQPLLRSREDTRWINPFPGETVAIHVDGRHTGGAFSVGEAIVEPDVGPPLHVHHNMDELLYVLEGIVDFALGEKRFRTGPGGFVLIPKGTPHAFRNFGPARARLLGVLTPSGFDGFFEAMEGRPLSEFVEIGARFGLEIVGPPLEAPLGA